MMRSLYSAVSGLKNHQTEMDVIGNNIANVNTVGFKASSINFVDMMSQILKGASSPAGSQGGTNAIQVGLGAMIGSINQDMSQGSAENTGNQTDLMLQGSGFFVLSNNGQDVYTRSGAFTFDKDGYLSDPVTGARVLGYSWGSDDTTPPNWPTGTNPNPPGWGPIKVEKGDSMQGNPDYTLSDYSIDQSGVITGIYTDSTGDTLTHKIGQVAVAQFSNDTGLVNQGDGYYGTSNNSGAASIGGANTSGRGIIIPGALEMSNVDLSTQFTDMIAAQRGFQANARVITVSDSLLQELVDLKRQ